MGKYDPLGAFLKSQHAEQVPMTFKQIERVTGAALPPSALQHRPWWSNSSSNSVMTKVWLEAGYKTEQVDMETRKLVFRRLRKSGGSTKTSAKTTTPIPDRSESNQHPLFGALKGLLSVASGTDLTAPADPSWREQS